MATFAEPAREKARPTTSLRALQRPADAAPQRANAAVAGLSHLGNQAAQRLLRANGPRLQAKLRVNAPGDAFEREADRVASAVVRGGSPQFGDAARNAAVDSRVSVPTGPRVQRACSCGELAGASGECQDCRRKREEGLQRKATSARPPAGVDTPNVAPPIVGEVLRAPGQPLDATTRLQMETRFGADFAHVRVHADAHAAESARAVNAHAYTVGSHVAFDAGRYAPGTRDGQRLIAHELAHVVQQNGARTSGSLPPALRRQPAPAAPTAPATPVEYEVIADDSGLVLATETGDHVVRLAKATRVRSSSSKGEWRSIEVLDGPSAGVTGMMRASLLKTAPPPPPPLPKSPTYDFVTKESDHERLADDFDGKADPDYVDKIHNTTYDVITGEFWLNYPDGAQYKMNYKQLRDAVTNQISIGDEKYQKLLEDAKKHKIVLPQGSTPFMTVLILYYYRDKKMNKIFPSAMTKGNLPNIADAVKQIEDARPDAELFLQLGMKLPELMIVGPIGGAARFAASRGAMSPSLRVAAARARAQEIRVAAKEAQALVKALKAENKPIIANIGGAAAKHEPAFAININPQIAGTERSVIPNLVETTGENIGGLFKKGQVDEVVGYHLPGSAINWNEVATGSARVLKSGGTFRVDFRGQFPEAVNQLTNALRREGFQSIKVEGGALITAVKP